MIDKTTLSLIDNIFSGQFSKPTWVFKLPTYEDQTFIPPGRYFADPEKYDDNGMHRFRILISDTIHTLYYDKKTLPDGWYHYSQKHKEVMINDIIEFINLGSEELRLFYETSPDFFI